ncbi:MAG: magnesium transporter CorA family protein [Acidimicrobiales bacterium]|nr:magnesium transporter CorA family protein [Acidimicrobiales bacterium]
MSSRTSRVYRDGIVVAENCERHELGAFIADERCIVWIDLCGPLDGELDQLADRLGLHELAVEDALEPHQRPKLDRYPDHLFLACRATSLDPDTADLIESEIDAFIGERWLITVRQDSAFDMTEVVARWDRSPDLARHGVGYLVYGLLDVVVDGYFDTVERFDEFYDNVSESIFAEHPLEPSQQLHWFQMRRSLFRLHRLAVPMRELVSSLMRREHSAVPEPLYPYFQDVYDHILRATESTDALRDLVSTIVETNLSLRDYRQNQIMKKVTSWAAIVAVPTLITGFYGMNVPYPGFGNQSGVIVSVVLMAAISALLYRTFRRRDWL